MSLALLLVVLPSISFAQATDGDEVVELEEFEVEGFREGLAKAMEEQRLASNLKDVLSSDSVGKLPDTNVAEALMRLPSLYIRTDMNEGRYVSIRGVDPILNNVTMNGQTIAASDTDGRVGRAAPLDVLSAASVSSIEVVKAVTPDMDGQSVGGTINIKTRSAFDYEGTYTSGTVETSFEDFCRACDNYKFDMFYSTRLGREKNIGMAVGVNYSYRDYMAQSLEVHRWFTLGPNGTNGSYRTYNPGLDGTLGHTDYPTFVFDGGGNPVLGDDGLQLLGTPESRPVTLDAAGVPLWTWEPVWGDDNLGTVDQVFLPNDQRTSAPDSGLNAFGDIVVPRNYKLVAHEGWRERKGIDGQLEMKKEKVHLWLRGYFTDYVDEGKRPEVNLQIQGENEEGRLTGDLDASGNPILRMGSGGGQLRLTSESTLFSTRSQVQQEGRFQRQERPVWQVVAGGEVKMGEAWTIDGNFNFTKAKEDKPFLWYMENKVQRCNNRSNDLGPIPENACATYDFSNPLWPVWTIGYGANADFDNFGWPVEDADNEELDFYILNRIRREDSEVEESTWTGDFNLRWDGELMGRRAWLKTGMKYLERDKFVDDGSFRYNYIGDRKTYADPGGDGSNGTLGVFFSQYGDQLGRFRVGDGAFNEAYARQLGPTANVEAFVNEFETYIGYDALNYDPVTNSPDPNLAILDPTRYRFDVNGSRGNSVEDDYNMTETITAWYGMANIELSERLTFVGGVRVEWTDSDLQAFNQGQNPADPDGGFDLFSVEVPIQFENVLPNAQIRWELSDNLLLRASYTATIGRPDYPDMNPIGEFEIERVRLDDPDTPQNDQIPQEYFEGSLEQGNPALAPYESDNYDVSLTYYLPDKWGQNSFISVGYFRKDIANAIYEYSFSLTDGDQSDDIDIGFPVVYDQTVTNTNGVTEDVVTFRGLQFSSMGISTKANADPGFIEGLEFTIQQNLTFLPSPFDGFGFVGNAAFMSSGVSVFQRPGEELPFFRQPDEVFNLQAFYQKYGLEARLAWRFQSDALGVGPAPEVGGSIYSDIYESERTMVDAKISYRINDNFSVYASVKNLTDEPFRLWSGGDPGRNGGEDGPGYEIYGRSYSVGVSWRFGR